MFVLNTGYFDLYFTNNRDSVKTKLIEYFIISNDIYAVEKLQLQKGFNPNYQHIVC